MVSDYETTNDTTEPQRKSFIPWLILIVLIILLCCCCVFIISGWFFGDMVLETFEQLMGGYY
jgi:flagellar basal body-associated protein FliL